jgi:hypothetical protein
MKKVITVSNCSDCPYYKYNRFDLILFCSKYESYESNTKTFVGRVFTKKEIETNKFPDWCPLEEKDL